MNIEALFLEVYGKKLDAEFAEAIAAAEAEPYRFSPHFEERMQALLQSGRPAAKRSIPIRRILWIAAAAVLVLCSLAFTSKRIRSSVAGFLVQVFGDHVEYSDPEITKTAIEEDTTKEPVTNDDVTKPDSEVQPQDHMAWYPFESEAEFKAALLSKECPDDLIQYCAGYYVPKSLPTGYTLGYIKATSYSVGFHYFNEGNDGLYGDREFCFAWNDGWAPEYLESDIKKEGIPYERYNDFYLMWFSETMSVKWIQGERVFYASMPIDTPLEVVETFCDAVYISLKP
ncbi:MAG: hypothetical protein IIT70_02825 [Clostridia bacterium]|nr:hypothetical protein [Clostridia bacterium]